MNFDAGCALIETALAGATRRDIAAEAATAKDFGQALLLLRDHMRANVWPAGRQRVNLERIVNAFDTRTRHDGFHVLHDWDGKADRVNDDIIPVDVLVYLMHLRRADASGTRGHRRE